jgi:hypothetical protein
MNDYAPCGPGGLDSLRDDFSDAAYSNTLWAQYSSGKATGVVAGGFFAMSTESASMAPETYVGIDSLATYRFSDCYAVMKISAITFASNTTLNWSLFLRGVTGGQQDHLRIYVEASGISFGRRDAGVDTLLGTRPLPTGAIWLRMVESGGMTSYGISNDGVLWGSPVATTETPAYAPAARVTLDLTVAHDVVSASEVLVDSFNTPP